MTGRSKLDAGSSGTRPDPDSKQDKLNFGSTVELLELHAALQVPCEAVRFLHAIAARQARHPEIGRRQLSLFGANEPSDLSIQGPEKAPIRLTASLLRQLNEFQVPPVRDDPRSGAHVRQNPIKDDEPRTTCARVLCEREMVQNDLDAIIYPVLTLPGEVTSQIFCWTVVKTGRIAFPHNLRLLGQSLHLGQICRLWCQIALSIPQLWNHMDFSINLGSDNRQIPSVSPIRTCLSRAASSPLSLFLDVTTQINDEPEYQGVEPILDAFAPHSKTWENVGFWTSLNSLRALSGIHKHLPQLKSLKLGLLDWNAPETPITLFEKAPLLQTVHLIELHSQIVTLPWSQLTVLHVEDLRAGELLD
ncbi:hypothetical protein B0H17DRAFT_1186723 [Mycena rosella]|uniref:F-box domain-containing protein n=1 Tax=Mycena rosella TaxID=1033263 RepID=A0AAD7CH27_MYCRO|nr:hypothetical protein B0H17DRAFT_1186723 [Mycena rosella]